jgi:hypothetical protein
MVLLTTLEGLVAEIMPGARTAEVGIPEMIRRKCAVVMQATSTWIIDVV